MAEPSLAQQSFLEQRKRKLRAITLARIFIFLLFLLIWEASARLHLIDAFIFSSPSRVCEIFVSMMADRSVFMHIGTTLAETLLSFFLVFLFSLLTAVLLWLFHSLSRILEPYLVVLNSLPKSALAPLLIVWLGANMKTIVAAGMSVAVFGSILTIYTGFSEVDPEKVKLIYTLGGNKRDVLRKVVLPSSVPIFINTMKVNIGLCLVGVVIGEFIGSRQGLGYLIIYGSQVFQLDMVLMSIVILCVMAMILYQGINLVEKHCLKRF
ncbi:MAG: ABC transporter permease [Lachnospiraceae bacterium]|uniref:ABC transporter permease n=1 Tax=Candidatus Merdisoma sp. JLR.KK011 TaxID=3114299 RepID=UPI0014338C62|nr:ABC transporter permease [Lachnospiraceae bacterium]MCI9253081.1 ABC transporter permease [Lachnospiraceae bacterium]MCI9479620.1 ABC transporter permease [Lachnospiraceae bacterium]GFI09727.1 riboflavin transport system permease protein RibX [Lachnospiraceae bacterium]